MVDSIDNFLRASRDLTEGGNRLGAAALDAVKVARRVLDDPECLEAERTGSLADFARRILFQHEKAQAAIADGEADRAAVWGMLLGKTITAAALKRTPKRGAGRPRGLGAVQSDAALIDLVIAAIAVGLPGAPAARGELEKRGIKAGIEERAKYAVRLARARLALGK